MEYNDFSETPFYKLYTKISLPYAETPIPIAREMLKMAEAKPGEIVVDLGCGEGNILIVAAKEFKCIAIGYEIDNGLIKIARKRIEKLGLKRYIKIFNIDLFKADISNADIITVYLTPEILDILKYKLKREGKRGLRIVSHDYPISGWRPRKIGKIIGSKYHIHRIYLYQL